MSRFSSADRAWMALALRLARRGEGGTRTNPQVGAVVVHRGRLVSLGWHARYGGDHAERMALQEKVPPGATLYVTLEPCAHHGKTPPCVDRVLACGLKRVVVGMQDPNPLVNGAGIQKLRAAGIAVESGCLEEACRQLVAPYLVNILQQRPWVTLKAGASLDGRITDPEGRSRFVTGAMARALGRSLRGAHEAVLVGAQTVREDDPDLRPRDAWWAGKEVIRVVLEGKKPLPEHLRLLRESDPASPVWRVRAGSSRGWQEGGVLVLPPDCRGYPDLTALMAELLRAGVGRLWVEGGGRIWSSFWQAGRVDAVELFVNQRLLGEGPRGHGLLPQGFALDQAPALTLQAPFMLGGDFWLRGHPVWPRISPSHNRGEG